MAKKIYFYSPNLSFSDKNSIWINPVPVYLSAHLQKTRPDLIPDISWVGYSIKPLTQQELVSELNNLDIDILLLSIYVWNDVHCYNMIKELNKQLNKPITIVAGGPSVDPFINKNYFVDHPEVDYAVYAQGEEAFVNILDNLINKKPLSQLTTKNLAWQQDDKFKLSAFEFLRLKEGSPYLIARDVLEWIVDHTIHNPKLAGTLLWLPYETSKGCPYNCSYCDWTSGLTHKVYHRTFGIEEELDLLGSLGVTNLSLSDANFGQHKQDIEITKTLIRLKEEKHYPFKIDEFSNYSKLKIKENFIIIDLLLGADILDGITISIQDIDDKILANIDRPALPWSTVRSYIVALQEKFPHKFYNVELIMGLPGQTRDSWERTLLEISQIGIAIVYPWIILPGSPAGYDPSYNEKMKIKTKGINLKPDVLYEYVVESYSFNFEDYIYMFLMSDVVKFLQKNETTGIELPTIFKQIKQSQHLTTVLDQITSTVSGVNVDHNMNVIIETFIKDILAEFNYSTTVIKMLNLKLKENDQD